MSPAEEDENNVLKKQEKEDRICMSGQRDGIRSEIRTPASQCARPGSNVPTKGRYTAVYIRKQSIYA